MSLCEVRYIYTINLWRSEWTWSIACRLQSAARELTFEESDIVKNAKDLRISSKQLKLRHGPTNICPSGSDVIQHHCELPFGLAFNLNKVNGLKSSSVDVQLSIAYIKGLYQLTFTEISSTKWARENKFYCLAQQPGMNQAQRKPDLNTLKKQVVLILVNYWKKTKPLKRTFHSEFSSVLYADGNNFLAIDN